MIRFTKFDGEGNITACGSFSEQNLEGFKSTLGADENIIYESSNPASQYVDIQTMTIKDKP